jgi:hypothetical protein
MNNRSSRMVLLVVGLTLTPAAVPTSLTTPQSPGRAEASASLAPTQSGSRPADPSTVLALAQRCVDPRHVALVSNALLRGRVFTPAEARGWCDD